jgi:hypothetical protein
MFFDHIKLSFLLWGGTALNRSIILLVIKLIIAQSECSGLVWHSQKSLSVILVLKVVSHLTSFNNLSDNDFNASDVA